MISSIKNTLENNQKVNNWQFSSALAKFSLHMEPSIYHQTAETLSFEVLENVNKSVMEAIDEFLAILQFRFEIREAIEN